MASILFLDIETACADPNGWAPKEEPTAPANYRDPDKIAEYVAEKRAELYNRTGLDSHSGRILCAGYAINDGPVQVAYDESLSNVRVILDALADAINEAKRADKGGRVLVCGHNICGFDAPFLWRTAVKHQHRLANLLPYRKWGDGLIDTMTMWSATNPRDMVGLDRIARFLGIEGKDEGMDGSKVWPAYQLGQHDRIRHYCAQDVELVRHVYQRMVDPDPIGF